MMDKVINLLKSSPVSIPRILLENYSSLGLTSDELVIIMYLLNNPDYTFNPQGISLSLKKPVNDVLKIVNDLSEKGIMSINVIKKGNIREEVYDFNLLYQKLGFIIINDEKKNEAKESTIFSTFESELGRTLSPMEYEIINTWQDGEYTEELIILALKEAIFNGVTSLRYIDKILYEWKKKGIKTGADVESSRKTFNTKKEDPKKIFGIENNIINNRICA
jgi:DNA replication protein